ncbi:MAG: PAS domain S-box protein [Nitrospiraceae bacterium]|nr:PAS domain S-box protein [Nitrospiraceae bacterium]
MPSGNGAEVAAVNGNGAYGRGIIIFLVAAVLMTAVAAGTIGGYYASRGERGGVLLAMLFVLVIPVLSYALYRTMIAPYYRRMEDANLELHIKQEELQDTKDDLFIKFLGIYDANYAANSPRLFPDRLKDVADITARVMGADVCLIYRYEKKKDELLLAATNGYRQEAVSMVRIPAGQGIEGWVARRIEPVVLKEFAKDGRFKEAPGLALSSYASIYCLPLYVYASGGLMGVIELLYSKSKNFSDEEINFFTTLAGILSNTMQNELLQAELRKMNMELEQWVAEKTEELRSSEERYRTLVENANEAIFVLSEAGDIVFANEHAVRLSGFGKFDLVHKNINDLADPGLMQSLLADAVSGGQSLKNADLRRSDGSTVPVEASAVSLTLIGRKFIQCVLRDMSAYVRLEQRLADRDREIAELRSRSSR